MSQSIPKCAIVAPKIPVKYRRAPRVATDKRRAGVLTVRAIRQFPTLDKASAYLSHRAKQHETERFAIQQTALNAWAVCRVIAGGV